MKEKSILITTLIISIGLELLLMVFVFNQVGGERLPFQIGRTVVQILLFGYIFLEKSETAIFLLTAYHILTALLIFYTKNVAEMINIFFISYHIIIGLIIYFHDAIGKKSDLEV